MTEIISRWFKKYFSDPQGIILALLLIFGLVVVVFFGDMLAPVLASIVIAYLLEGPIRPLERRGTHRMLLVFFVFIVFLAILLLFFFGLVPRVTTQTAQLVQDLPAMIDRGQQMLLRLPELYPRLINDAQLHQIINAVAASAAAVGKKALSLSLTTLMSIFTLLVYLVLVPVLVFFMLKDKKTILAWLASFLPPERSLAERVWREMDHEIGNYVRGKFAEIIVVGVATYVVFALMKLKYATLLAVLVGLSVIVPYIGAVVVTIPVLLVALSQWGWTSEFAYVMLAYTVIQTLDGYVLVPWLFSEAVNLHPIAIIVAILIFGGIWGFWGVFFAIPLATLVKVLIATWPRSRVVEE
ncbi:MAG: AI-2E family transporter [Gammaproteobacteria bacterium]|jgi:putative permease